MNNRPTQAELEELAAYIAERYSMPLRDVCHLPFKSALFLYRRRESIPTPLETLLAKIAAALKGTAPLDEFVSIDENEKRKIKLEATLQSL